MPRQTPPRAGETRIGLIGAGNIARIHAEVVASLPGRHVSAVIDPSVEARARLLRACPGARDFADVADALAADAFDRAHVLVPPDLHDRVALPVLRAGKPVLVEKPLATDSAACAALIAAATEGGTWGGVNQNFVHHPAFARLRAALAAGRIGRLVHVRAIYHMPLRQLAARQFGHWMFRAPANVLLEQAVHPLSQILTLAGAVVDVRALAGPAMPIAPGMAFHPGADVLLAGAVAPATLGFRVGAEYPAWRITAHGTDGIVTADILANRLRIDGRTRFLDALDQPITAWTGAAREAREAGGNLARHALRMLGRARFTEPFAASMRAAVAAFHDAADRGAAPASDLAFGAALVRLCERIAATSFTPAATTPRPASPAADDAADIVLLGGTGFIGTHLTRALLAAGKRVRVMARAVHTLPEVFHEPGVRLMAGDIAHAETIARAIAGVPVVVNLAHGGGGADYAAVRAAMVGGAERVARACLAAGTRQLIHIGSIAGLYLGPQRGPITGATPPDPFASRRADYARAKAECDAMLLALHRAEGLPVTILRPGLVVGEGTDALHSGLGSFNNPQHCLGWNAGTNPLPFVLVTDVADAILRAADRPETIGRCYNLIGDIRPSARAYIADLAAATARPLRFHPQSPTRLFLIECGKWLIKRAGGRDAPFPSRRDILSRGMRATFDCTDAKRDLGWQPCADAATFHRAAIAIHAPDR